MPEHFEEWWGYGTFFLVSAVAQVLYVPLLLRWPNQTILLLGIGGNFVIVLLYILTRTVGIPAFGPHAGEVEGVGLADLCATTSELEIVVALGVMLLWVSLPRGDAWYCSSQPWSWYPSGTSCTCCFADHRRSVSEKAQLCGYPVCACEAYGTWRGVLPS